MTDIYKNIYQVFSERMEGRIKSFKYSVDEMIDLYESGEIKKDVILTYLSVNNRHFRDNLNLIDTVLSEYFDYDLFNELEDYYRMVYEICVDGLEKIGEV